MQYRGKIFCNVRAGIKQAPHLFFQCVFSVQGHVWELFTQMKSAESAAWKNTNSKYSGAAETKTSPIQAESDHNFLFFLSGRLLTFSIRAEWKWIFREVQESCNVSGGMNISWTCSSAQHMLRVARPILIFRHWRFSNFASEKRRAKVEGMRSCPTQISIHAFDATTRGQQPGQFDTHQNNQAEQTHTELFVCEFHIEKFNPLANAGQMFWNRDSCRFLFFY